MTEAEATHAFLWQNGILTNLNQLIDCRKGYYE
ncbi:MAG: hypothetical protein H0X66_12085 [Verrucomicrobia bacterium]|nr:hypothetical protein [Verrucomicrobiota bacterium]